MKKLFTLIGMLSMSTLLMAQESDEDLIRKNITAFSKALMEGDTTAVIDSYTSDGKILPNGTGILNGEQLKEYWCRGIRNGQIYYHHKVTPEEIKVLGEYAYDYGYYEGESGRDDKRSKWQGKYVIIWHKVNTDWKIYVDIWNSVPLTN